VKSSRIAVLLAFMLLIAAVSFTLLSCAKNEAAFSGLVGQIAPGPMKGAVVSVFDGSHFIAASNPAGLIGTTTLDSTGKFTLAVPDKYIGRTLVVAVTFPADDPQTAADERATYIGYQGPGETVTMNPGDGPWYALVDYFEGLTVRLSITPLSTAAFLSLQALPAAEAGVGPLRYTQSNAQRTNRITAAAFGLAGDMTRAIPSQPALGGNHPAPRRDAANSTPDAAALAYVLTQCEHAATAFAAATDDTTDNQLAFYAGLFNDARDGALDGRLNGATVPQFAVPGAPTMTGQVSDGSSRVIRYIESAGTVTATEESAIRAASTSVFPETFDIHAAQLTSTGAARPPAIHSIDTRLVPQSGGIDITVTGAGFAREHEVILASDENSLLFPSGNLIHITKFETGQDGALLSLTHDKLVFRVPNLKRPTTPGQFLLQPTDQQRKFNLWLRFDTDGYRTGPTVDQIVATLNEIRDDSLHVIDSSIVRLLAMGIAGPAVSSAGVLPATTDPISLDPQTDAAFALKLRIFNGAATGASGVTLHLGRTGAINVGHATVGIAPFGDPGVAPLRTTMQAALDAAALALPSLTDMTLLVPVAFDASHVGVGQPIDFGQLVTVTPVVTGILASAPTTAVFSNTNVALDIPATHLVAASSAQTPTLSTASAPRGHSASPVPLPSSTAASA
jgi:hypothetical protein